MVRALLVSLVCCLSADAALRFTPERAVSPVTTGPAWGMKRSASVATNGTDFLVVWHDERGGSYPSSIRSFIVGTRVSGSGELLDPAGFVITDLPDRILRGVSWDGTSYRVSVYAYQIPADE